MNSISDISPLPQSSDICVLICVLGFSDHPKHKGNSVKAADSYLVLAPNPHKATNATKFQHTTRDFLRSPWKIYRSAMNMGSHLANYNTGWVFLWLHDLLETFRAPFIWDIEFHHAVLVGHKHCLARDPHPHPLPSHLLYILTFPLLM